MTDSKKKKAKKATKKATKRPTAKKATKKATKRPTARRPTKRPRARKTRKPFYSLANEQSRITVADLQLQQEARRLTGGRRG